MEDKENMSEQKFAEFLQRQEKRKKEQEKRAERALRKQWKKAARNVRGMRSFGGYSIGTRSIRSFKEIKNKRYIQERRGEEALRIENDKLKQVNRKLQDYRDFLLKNGIMSLLDESNELKGETKREMKQELMKNLGKFALVEKRKKSKKRKKKQKRPLPDQSAFSPEKRNQVSEIINLTDSPYNLYK